ncbi:MAG: monoheme cytochrome C [Flavobacteriaceae bacterium]|nr:monoheme cytochrome C [Flavobacteriaceae bacterium]
MENNKHKDFTDGVLLIYKQFLLIFFSLGLFICALLYVKADPSFSFFRKSENTIAYVVIDEDKIENGIHLSTGLIDAEGLMTVVHNCTNCHSAKLVTQNRMNKERWAETIDWMQEKQNLWDLGTNEEIIINYLVKNYPVEKKGRRQVLTNIEWYELEN